MNVIFVDLDSREHGCQFVFLQLQGRTERSDSVSSKAKLQAKQVSENVQDFRLK